METPLGVAVGAREDGKSSVDRNTKSKWTRFVLLAVSAAVVALVLAGCRRYSSTCDASDPGDACCRLKDYQENEGLNVDLGVTDIAVGTSESVACRNRVRMLDRPTLLFSASKMVTGYTILKLVDNGLLSLDTKVADVLDFWDSTDGRQHITVRHLLSQTSGLTKYPGGLGQCKAATTLECAREAYEVCFAESFTGPGESFEYTESTFFVVSAMALEVTSLPGWNDVFQQYMAQPLGIDGDGCFFRGAEKAPAGGSLNCVTLEYGKILQAILGKTLFTNSDLYIEAEMPHTLDHRRVAADPTTSSEEIEEIKAPSSLTQDQSDTGCDPAMMPICTTGNGLPLGHYRHYGLGQWIECSTPRCEGGILRASSTGAFGTYPWVDRGALTGNTPHWGIVVRWGNADGAGLANGPSIIATLTKVVPLAAEIVNRSEIVQ